MVSLRPDWCLSRQRYWGVPIPALVCNGCKEELLAVEVIDHFAALVAKEGSDCWFIREAADFIPAGFSCPHCKEKSFSKGRDILDVWFDSGVSSQAVLKKREELAYPADLYLEGSDQHRGWFQSSLIPAMCIDGKPPFKCVLTHGHVVDGVGRKMSKSLGNVISPQDIIKDYGADIVRLWVASSDYNEDIRISKEMLARLSESYRKIRNTARFILSNLYDFNPDTDKVEYEALRNIDKFILWKANSLLIAVKAGYESFSFYYSYQYIYNFCNSELSMYYLDMIKGRLYTFAAASVERRAAQTAIYEILNVLVRLMAPILVFTAEEIWQHMPKEEKDSSVSSVHLLDWPEELPYGLRVGTDISDPMTDIWNMIPDVAKELEDMRGKGQIGSSFDARINLLTNKQERYTFLSSLEDDLCEIFKVSQVEIIKENNLTQDIEIRVTRAEGKKCLRCWNYSLSVGSNEEHQMLCKRCVAVIGGS
jgi:isoleucyl-tRNA synthetase